MYKWEVDAVVSDALRQAPLVPAPTQLFPSVMSAIRREDKKLSGQSEQLVQQRFRVSWLDIALSLFGALMFGLVWVVWGLFQSNLAAPRLEYVRSLMLWNIQRALYSDAALMVLVGLAGGALLIALFVAGMGFSRWDRLHS